MWEITITCHDGTRLRLLEWRDAAPRKGEVVETGDTGQIIKAMIDACREEKVGWFTPALFPGHRDRGLKSADMKPALPAALDCRRP